jgi:flagella basal body P-ring formation protein FlgA
VVTAAKPLLRGTVLKRSDIRIEQMDVALLRGSYYRNIEDVTGKVLTRGIAANAPLSSHALKKPLLVKRGQRVVIAAIAAELAIRAAGEALMDGAQGDIIKVRNNRSQRVVEGLVTSAGVVEVRM